MRFIYLMIKKEEEYKVKRYKKNNNNYYKECIKMMKEIFLSKQNKINYILSTKKKYFIYFSFIIC